MTRLCGTRRPPKAAVRFPSSSNTKPTDLRTLTGTVPSVSLRSHPPPLVRHRTAPQQSIRPDAPGRARSRDELDASGAYKARSGANLVVSPPRPETPAPPVHLDAPPG